MCSEVADRVCRRLRLDTIVRPMCFLGAPIMLTVLLCTRVDYTGVCVCEFGELHAILFTQSTLVMASFFHTVYLDRLVAVRSKN
jgi:hypothetical protein